MRYRFDFITENGTPVFGVDRKTWFATTTSSRSRILAPTAGS